MKSFFIVFLSFFSLGSFALGGVLEPVVLPPEVKSGLKGVYQETRGEADSCGVSLVEVFRMEEGVDLSEAVGLALAEVSEKAPAVDWVLRKQEGVLLYENPETISVHRLIFDAISSFPVLFEEALPLSKEISDLMGSSEVLLLVHEEITPAPNVDGNVEVGMTPDRKYLVVVVSDYGA
jgi:hypothetical protein